MKKAYFYNVVFLIFFFLFFSAGLKVFSGITHLVPELVLLVTIIFALKRSYVEILWFSFFAGLLLELFSGEFPGARIFATVLPSFLVYFVTRKLTDRQISLPTAVFLILVCTLFSHLLIYVYQGFFALFGIVDAIPIRSLVNWEILGTILSNLLFFYPIFFLHRFLPK